MSAVGDDEYESSDDDDELSSSSGEDESSDESSSGTSDSDDDNDNQAKDQTDDDLAKAKAVADDVAAIKRLANDMQKIYLRLKYRHDRPKESAVMTAPLSPKPEEHEELPSTEPVSKPLRPHPLEIPTEPSTIRFTKTDAATDSDDLHLPPTVPAVASLVKLPFEDVLSKSIESNHSNVLAKGQIDIECKLQMELKHTTPLHLLQYMLGTPQVKTEDATSRTINGNDDDNDTLESPSRRRLSQRPNPPRSMPYGKEDSTVQLEPTPTLRRPAQVEPTDSTVNRRVPHQLSSSVAPLPPSWTNDNYGDEAELPPVITTEAATPPKVPPAKISSLNHPEGEVVHATNDEELEFNQQGGDESSVPVDVTPPEDVALPAHETTDPSAHPGEAANDTMVMSQPSDVAIVSDKLASVGNKNMVKQSSVPPAMVPSAPPQTSDSSSLTREEAAPPLVQPSPQSSAPHTTTTPNAQGTVVSPLTRQPTATASSRHLSMPGRLPSQRTTPPGNTAPVDVVLSPTMMERQPPDTTPARAGQMMSPQPAPLSTMQHSLAEPLEDTPLTSRTPITRLDSTSAISTPPSSTLPVNPTASPANHAIPSPASVPSMSPAPITTANAPWFSPLTSPVFSSPLSSPPYKPRPTMAFSSDIPSPMASRAYTFDTSMPKDLRVTSPPMSPSPDKPGLMTSTRSFYSHQPPLPFGGSASTTTTIEYEVNAMHYLLFGPPP